MDTDPGDGGRAHQCSRPNTLEDMQSFLGLVGYFREHVQNYMDITIPLYALAKKGIFCQWSGEAEKAYQATTGAPRLTQGGWIVDAYER